MASPSSHGRAESSHPGNKPRAALPAARRARWTNAARLCAVLVALAFGPPLATLAAPTGSEMASDVPLDDSACVAAVDRTVAPTEVAVGGTVAVTTSIRFDCPPSFVPIHIAFVLDASGSMAGEGLDEAKAGILALLDSLGIGSDEHTKAALVAFDDTVKLSCPLTAVREEIVACLDRVEGSGGSAIDTALAEGLRLLLGGRAEPPAGERREVMILLSDGGSSTGCEPVVAEAARVKSQGVLLITVAIGDASDHSCLRQVASSPRYFFVAGFPSELIEILNRIRDVVGRAIRRLEIFDTPPSSFVLVPDSAEPGALIDPTTGRLSWSMNFVATSGVTVTFRLRALDAGLHASSDEAVAEWIDVLGDTGRAIFPVADVLVAEGPPPPPAPPIDLDIELDAHSVPVGGRTDGRFALEVDLPHLPARTHLMLVLDASGSMLGEPLTAQKAAVHALIDALEAEADPAFRGGLVAYQATGELLCALTPDFDALRDCVDRMTAAGGTSMVDALAMAHAELTAARSETSPPEEPVAEDVVLMSDGANSTGCPPVEEVASAIKADGATIHTICLGPACDAACFERVATGSTHHRVASRPDELSSAYAAVGDELRSFRPVKTAVMRLDLPAHLTFDAAAFIPPPGAHDERSAYWFVHRFDAARHEVRFGVRATADGSAAPTGWASLLFESGAVAETRVDGPRVSSGPIPSETLDPSTPPPSPTPPITPWPEPSATSSSPAGRIYLPIGLREACASLHPADIAVALDTSTSMGELGPDGIAKIDAARAAILDLFDGLGVGDRLGLVGFDDGARVLHGLTAERDRIAAALGTLALGPNTSIDQGIDAARRLLEDGAESGATGVGVGVGAEAEAGAGVGVGVGRGADNGSGPEDRAASIIVVVTDGRPFPASAESAIEAADRAREAGMAVFAIGLGSEVDAAALKAIAGDSRAVRFADGRPAVVAAFRTVGRWLDCGPPIAFWGRRSAE